MSTPATMGSTSYLSMDGWPPPADEDEGISAQPSGSMAALEVDRGRGPTVVCPAERWWVAFGSTNRMVYFDGEKESSLTVTYGDSYLLLDIEVVIGVTLRSPQSPWMQSMVRRLRQCCNALGMSLELQPDYLEALVLPDLLPDTEEK